jgi:hypothetical protein
MFLIQACFFFDLFFAKTIQNYRFGIFLLKKNKSKPVVKKKTHILSKKNKEVQNS